MSQKNAKQNRAAKAKPGGIPTNVALRDQFAIVGELSYRVRIMTDQLNAFETESQKQQVKIKKLEETIKKLKGKK